MIKRLWILAFLVLAMGAVTAFVPPRKSQSIDEDWMEQRAPRAVGELSMVPPRDGDPGQTYKMGENTYRALEPAGIVARVYSDGRQAFDVVLIASDNSRSFHDPRVCFTASGWHLTDQREETVETRTRGRVPVTFVKMVNENGREKSALFFYRGPGGFISGARKMRWDMFVTQVTRIKNEQGVFYRIIPADGVSDEDLLKFAGRYLDAAQEASQGFF